MESVFLLIGILITIMYIAPFAYIHFKSSDKGKLTKLFSSDANKLGINGKVILFGKKAIIVNSDKTTLYVGTSDSYHIENSNAISIKNKEKISILLNHKVLNNQFDYASKIDFIEFNIADRKNVQLISFTVFDSTINNPLDGMDYLDKAKRVLKEINK